MTLLDISTQLASNVWLILLITIWEAVWTGLAMWRSARLKHTIWFVIFLIVNLLGIPEIVYLIVTKKKRKR